MHTCRAVLTSEQGPVRLGFFSVYFCMFSLAKVCLIVVGLGLTWDICVYFSWLLRIWWSVPVKSIALKVFF